MTSARPRRQRRQVSALFAVVGALVATSCGGGDSTSGASDLNIDILTPTDGDATGDSFELAVDASVPFGEPDTGRHHMHLYYDGNVTEGEYDIVYGESAVIDHLGAGEHTVEAAIANADHSLTGASDTITIDVGAGTGAGTGTVSGDPTAPPTTPPVFDYDY